jgi:hypothetical protein
MAQLGGLGDSPPKHTSGVSIWTSRTRCPFPGVIVSLSAT